MSYKQLKKNTLCIYIAQLKKSDYTIVRTYRDDTMISECYIFDALRTPRGRGKSNGSLHPLTSVELLSQCLAQLRKRSLSDPSQLKCISDVMIGCVSAVGEQGANIGRSACMSAGYPYSIPTIHVNRFCASSLSAINLAAAQINAQSGRAIIAGGVEMMSKLPIGSDGGALMVDPEIVYKHAIVPLGISADLIATREKYHRHDLDKFSLNSHKKAALAQAEGYFNRSIIPILDINQQIILEHDEQVRQDASLEQMSKLQPSFAMMGHMGGFDQLVCQKFSNIAELMHTHTPANSSGIVDGAAVVLLGNGSLKATGLKPRARILTYYDVGVDPTDALSGPALAAQKALKSIGMNASDIDLWEINEAFASVAMYAIDQLNIDPAQVNVNGGSIALGHPLGATGAILMNTLVDELERQNLSTGCVSMCIGSGMATATIIERV